MNILLNISLTPSAMRGHGPVTVQATAVNATDFSTLSSFSPSQTGVHNASNESGFSHWNGSKAGSDSPLDLALTSVRGTSSSASESHRASRVSSSSHTNYKHSATSSLAGAAGDCSPAKQQRLSNDSAYHQSAHSKASANHSGAAVCGVRRSPGQYEGSRRKLNPAFLTHIKPRTSEVDVGGRSGRAVMSSSSELDENLTLAHSNSVVDDEDLVHVLNLKQEVEWWWVRCLITACTAVYYVAGCTPESEKLRPSVIAFTLGLGLVIFFGCFAFCFSHPFFIPGSFCFFLFFFLFFSLLFFIVYKCILGFRLIWVVYLRFLLLAQMQTEIRNLRHNLQAHS